MPSQTNSRCSNGEGRWSGKSTRMVVKKMDDDEPTDTQVKSAAAAGATNQEFLVRGQKFCKTRSSSVELWMPEGGTFLSKSHLATIICGMLNSPSGGTIYIGVGEDGTVWGLDLDRSGRDLLRRNLAKVMKDNIHPIVLCPSKVSIDFVPVDCQGGDRATVVVVNIAAFPTCGQVWEALRIYQARCLNVVELEGRYLRMEAGLSTFNQKMNPIDIINEVKNFSQNEDSAVEPSS